MERSVTAVDPSAVPVTDEEEIITEPRTGKPIVPEGEEAIPLSLRDQIAAKLPESWSKSEIDTFIKTYYGKIPEVVDAQEVETLETLVEEMDVTKLPVSSLSRNGFTLDTHVIIDGRSVTLRAVYDAGQLVPNQAYITEGPQRNPRRVVHYTARVVDRNMIFAITEETYKSLSKAYPQTVPHDEPLTLRGIKNVQSKTTPLTADNMERVLPTT